MQNEQDILIGNYIKANEAAQDAEMKMKKHFKDLITPHLLASRTDEDFIKVKRMLSDMPECASKVLLFRSILLTQKHV